MLLKLLISVDFRSNRFGIEIDLDFAFRLQTLVAKQSHFAYSTPKKVRAFRTAIDFEDSGDVGDEIETPNAPKQSRPIKSRLFGKNLDSISVNLFN